MTSSALVLNSKLKWNINSIPKKVHQKKIIYERIYNIHGVRFTNERSKSGDAMKKIP